MPSDSALAATPATQRPRERLQRLGSGSLSDVELVAVLLGTGRVGTNVLDLAARLLRVHGGLGGLRHADATTLAREPGVGPAKAARLVAALDLGGRAARASDEREVVERSSDVARVTAARFAGARRERVVLVVCGPGNRVIDTCVLADGSVHGAAFPVRDVLAEVLRRDGTSFALAHNHPGGEATPSVVDRQTTVALRDAARQVGVELLDHVVVAGGEWRSTLG